MSTVKTKWIKLSLNTTIKHIGDLLLSSNYDEDLGYGFDLFDLNQNSFNGQYIEKNSFHEKIISPDGNEKTISFDRYLEFNFSVYKGEDNSAFLKVINPPVSLKKFIMNLSGATNKSISITSSFLDIESLSSMINEKWGTDEYRIKRVSISDLQLTDTGVSKIEITSEKNAMDDFLTSFSEKKYKLNRIKIFLVANGLSGNIELSRTGMIFMDSNIYSITEEGIPDLVMRNL